MKLLGLSLVLAISSGALGLRVSYSGDVSDPGDDGAGPTTAGPQQLDGWAPYVRDKSGNRPLFNRSTAEKDFIPIFITDNAKAGNPVYLGPDFAVGSNGTVVGQENVTWKVESSSGFEAWLDSLTSVDGASGGQQKKNLVLLFGSASTGYSQHSWEAMQEPLTKKFDDLDEEFQDQGGWILVTNGDGYYNSKSLTDIAVHVAQRGTPVVFVQSDYGGTFPSVKEDGNNYWPPYACGGLFGHGIDHGIPEFKPDGKTFKGKKHCWGGIAKSGWLEKDLAKYDGQAFGDKVAEDKKSWHRCRNIGRFSNCAWVDHCRGIRLSGQSLPQGLQENGTFPGFGISSGSGDCRWGRGYHSRADENVQRLCYSAH